MYYIWSCTSDLRTLSKSTSVNIETERIVRTMQAYAIPTRSANDMYTLRNCSSNHVFTCASYKHVLQRLRSASFALATGHNRPGLRNAELRKHLPNTHCSSLYPRGVTTGVDSQNGALCGKHPLDLRNDTERHHKRYW